MNSLRYQTLQGASIATQLAPLAELRLTVFREWPYLYQGTLAYEQHYLETYLHSSDSLAVLVWDGEQCVGATTALPLLHAQPEMRAPFEQLGLRVADYLYFGESVVRPSHRGLGIGVRFFELREAHARSLSLTRCCFCAVERPTSHPLRPTNYLGNDAFWQHRGYTRQPDLACEFEWQDIDQAASSAHRLSFWTRTL